MEKKESGSVKQEQVHEILFNNEIGWQEVIYDLINTEQLDPWDVNIIILTNRYLEKIQEFEEQDFFVSSKVLLAASLLLRIKSEILLNDYIKSIDEILFGQKPAKQYGVERIELEEEIPELVPRSPLPRFKKVSLKELMESLNKAIITENRRIQRKTISRNALREVSVVIPKKKFDIGDKIRDIHGRLLEYFKKNSEEKKLPFSEFVGENKDEKIISFSSLLHLENQKKIWMEQDEHFGEIHLWLKKTFLKHNPRFFDEVGESEED